MRRLKETSKEMCRLIEEDKEMDMKNKDRQQMVETMQENIRFACHVLTSILSVVL